MTDTIESLFIVQYHSNAKKVRIETAKEMLQLNKRGILKNTNNFYVVVGIASTKEEAVKLASEFELKWSNLTGHETLCKMRVCENTIMNSNSKLLRRY